MRMFIFRNYYLSYFVVKNAKQRSVLPAYCIIQYLFFVLNLIRKSARYLPSFAVY